MAHTVVAFVFLWWRSQSTRTHLAFDTAVGGSGNLEIADHNFTRHFGNVSHYVDKAAESEKENEHAVVGNGVGMPPMRQEIETACHDLLRCKAKKFFKKKRGSGAQLWLADYDGREVVIKIDTTRRILAERSNMQKMRSVDTEILPELVRDNDDPNRLVMEFLGPPCWMTLGSLVCKLPFYKVADLEYDDATQVWLSLLETLTVLKETTWMHCDLHAYNIMINRCEHMKAKLIDWESSREGSRCDKRPDILYLIQVWSMLFLKRERLPAFIEEAIAAVLKPKEDSDMRQVLKEKCILCEGHPWIVETFVLLKASRGLVEPDQAHQAVFPKLMALVDVNAFQARAAEMRSIASRHVSETTNGLAAADGGTPQVLKVEKDFNNSRHASDSSSSTPARGQKLSNRQFHEMRADETPPIVGTGSRSNKTLQSIESGDPQTSKARETSNHRIHAPSSSEEAPTRGVSVAKQTSDPIFCQNAPCKGLFIQRCPIHCAKHVGNASDTLL